MTDLRSQIPELLPDQMQNRTWNYHKDGFRAKARITKNLYRSPCSPYLQNKHCQSQKQKKPKKFKKPNEPNKPNRRNKQVIILSLIFAFFFPGFAFSQGEVFLSFWNRSYYSDDGLTRPYEYETNYRFGFSQFVPNYGKLELWLDGVQTQQGFKLGRGLLSFNELLINRFKINSSYGDTYFTFTNLEDRFSNTYYPYVYFRGGKIIVSTPGIETVFFGGKAANLRGIFGTTYKVSEQNVYGFNTRIKPSSSITVGTGYIYTENEQSYSEELLTRSNNIFLLDGEYKFSKKIKVLGEYKFSRYLPAGSSERKNGFSLRVGPIIRTEKLSLEANYRHISSDYRFVSLATQLEQDQEGFFLLTEYKLSKFFSIIGNADRYRNNLSQDPQKNTIYSTRGLLGFSYYSPFWPSLSFRLGLTERKTRKHVENPLDSITYNYYLHLFQNFNNFNLYLRYSRHDIENRINPTGKSSQDAFNLGIRHYFKRNNMIWFEGESISNRDINGDVIGRDLRARIGLNYYHSANVNFYSIATYSKMKRTNISDRDKFDLYLTLSLRLPLGFNLSLNLGADRYLNLPEKEQRGTNYRLTMKIDKRLRWGKPLTVIRETTGIGTGEFGTIQGHIFNDLNLNGIKDRGEKGYPGIKISLQDGTTVETGAEGKYKFSRVRTGTNKVKISLTDIPIELNFLDELEKQIEVKHRKTVEVDFRLITSAFISGRIINDTNKNGQIDPDEKGKPDVLVWLQPVDERKNTEPLNTYTDKEGNFSFEYIIPGTYFLFPEKESLPEKTIFTGPEKLKIDIAPGEKLANQTFLVFIPPRPIRIDSEEQNKPFNKL